MLARVRDIRQREHLFIDQINEYYDDFSVDIEGAYHEWAPSGRCSSRREQRETQAEGGCIRIAGFGESRRRTGTHRPRSAGPGWASIG